MVAIIQLYVTVIIVKRFVYKNMKNHVRNKPVI